jgi:probable F420-dependent oxidoreductase
MDIALLIPLAAPFASTEFVELLGPRAEQCGFSALWVGEHVVVPDEWESLYPASDDGLIPDAVQQGELDPFSTLGYLAAITENIRLGVCCNVAQRNPVYTAKEAANVDWLSGGRLEFGAGVGWASEEFEACGMPFERRGSRARSHLEVMRRLWREPVAEYSDEFYTLRPSLLYPKPVQKPRLPIHILGDSKAALRRVADFGDGFLPMDIEPESLADPLSILDMMLAERDRSRDEITVSVIPPVGGCDLDKVKRYRDAGADRVVIMEFVHALDQLEPVIDRLAEQIVEPARGL